MILDFKKDRRTGLGAQTVGVLRGLHDHWEQSRSGADLPRAEDLFLSDLSVEMPNVLLAYRDDRSFRIEFAGDAIIGLLGMDPIGTRAVTKTDLPAALSHSIRRAARGREPAYSINEGLQILCLPYLSEAEEIDLVLVGIAATAVQSSGQVVALVR